MSETPKAPNFESAEKKFMIDRESGYFKAINFSEDPVKYFSEFKKKLLEDGFVEADLGIQAMSELAELDQILCNEGLAAHDARVTQMLDSEYISENWAKAVFPFLKEAGFSIEQLKSWFEESDDELTPEEKFRERTMMVYLNEVYKKV